jgi:2-hydroxy-3-keto-5-methylthiopentenyl-1-phosphate phosphatase
MSARLDLDLARTSVFLDFDGTISTEDIGLHLLERFARDGWRDLSEQFARGVIGSRECLLDEWDLLAPDEGRLRAAAQDVALDTGFAPLVEELGTAGAEVTVVSDGFGFYVDDACRRAGVDVPVLTNAVDWETGRLEFPHEDRCCPCTSCGVCKQAPIKDAHRRGRVTVLVGDGTSDRKAALVADVVFAKGALARWCAAAGVAHHAFDSLDQVRTALLSPNPA